MRLEMIETLVIEELKLSEKYSSKSVDYKEFSFKREKGNWTG